MRKVMHAIVFGLIVAMCAVTQVKAAAEVDVIPDVVYGHKDGLALTFDIFKPKANVIALRHGSSPKYLIPDIVADVRRAVRFIRYNAKQWGIDPNRLGVYGGSAGGHLSLMIGTASDNGDPTAKDFLKESDRVAAIVAYFPPVDLRTLARGLNPPPSGTVLDRFPALNFEKEKAADYSPIVFVTSDDPPTLLIHGDKDELVNISNSKIIFEAFQKVNVKTDFITIPGAGHGFRGEDAKRATAAMVSWFEQTLLKPATKP